MEPLDICYMSAGQLSGLIKNKEISPVEVIDAHLARIEATEPVLNSFITLLPDEARAAARRAETDIQRGNYKGPLHGIPVGLKDLFNTAGVRTTSGSKLFDNFIPDQDCTVAAKFGAAGAILLGKLNMHQFAFGPTGENPDYGHMHNPWNPELITGGSSGGSGSAVAAGQCTITTGSDTGGSVRIPAALCGIVGLKPTYGLVSRAGLTPLSWSLDHPGPMVRTVEDAALSMNVMAGYDPGDVASARVDVPDYTTALTGDVRGLRIGVPKEYFDAPLDPQVGQAVRDALDVLESLGATVTEVSFPHVSRCPAHLDRHTHRRGGRLPPRPANQGRGPALPAGAVALGGGAVHQRRRLPAGPTGAHLIRPSSPPAAGGSGPAGRAHRTNHGASTLGHPGSSRGAYGGGHRRPDPIYPAL